jgi:phosphopantetheine--protein transferase-like protein
VTICTNDMGKPYAIGEWLDFLSAKLDIAIAHTAQFVIALAGANVKIGVDVENATRNLSEDFTAGVFNPEELDLAAHALNPAQTIIRFWCAKEAVSKALGVGIRYSPKDMRVVAYNAETCKLSMRLYGGWLDAFHNFKGRDIEVTVRYLNDHALAFCFIPAILLADD